MNSVVFFDIRKAFYTVDDQILTQKLWVMEFMMNS